MARSLGGAAKAMVPLDTKIVAIARIEMRILVVSAHRMRWLLSLYIPSTARGKSEESGLVEV